MQIFLAEGNADVRLGLQMLLNNQPDMVVTGIAVNATGLTEQVVASQPDVLLVNWNLPGSTGSDVLSQIRNESLQLAVVVMSIQPDMGPVAMAAGADLFIPTIIPPDNFVALLRNVNSIRMPGNVNVESE